MLPVPQFGLLLKIFTGSLRHTESLQHTWGEHSHTCILFHIFLDFLQFHKSFCCRLTIFCEKCTVKSSQTDTLQEEFCINSSTTCSWQVNEITLLNIKKWHKNTAIIVSLWTPWALWTPHVIMIPLPPSLSPSHHPLTSSVWDVCAVKGNAFPPVENEWVLQQVHRGESVSTQSWEDEVQKAAHPSLQIRPRELLTEALRVPPQKVKEKKKSVFSPSSR